MRPFSFSSDNSVPYGNSGSERKFALPAWTFANCSQSFSSTDVSLDGGAHVMTMPSRGDY